MKYIKTLINISIVFCISKNIMAAGLGYLQIKSTLDKPLVAFIPILGDIEPNTTAELGSAEEYNNQNIEYNHNLDSAIVKIIKFNNKNIIRITTINNFNEPVLNLLIKLKYNNQIIQKNYTKFIELTPDSAVNTAKLVDTSINPASDLSSPTISIDIPSEYTTRARGDKNDVQYTKNQGIDNIEAEDNQSQNSIIESTGTVYVEKKSNDKIKIKNNKNISKINNSNKKIQIDIEKSIKIDNIPLSNSKALDDKAQNKSSNIKPDELLKENNNLKASIKEKNTPTLKLDNLSASDMQNASSVASQLQANENLMGNGVGLNASSSINTSSVSSSPAFFVENTNLLQNNISLTSSSSSLDKNSKLKLMDNKSNSKHLNNIGIFEILNLNIKQSVKQPWFYIASFILFLLSIAGIYIWHLKKYLKSNLKQKQEEINLIKQQISLFNQKGNSSTQTVNSVDNSLFNNDEEIEKKRKRKRRFF